MIEDENHPEFQRAHQDLMRRLGVVIGIHPKPLDRSMLDKMYAAVKDHRTHWRMKGVDFPVLVALVVPRIGSIHWARADLDSASLKTTIVNFVRMNPEASMQEVVEAFRAAFPDLKPGDVLEYHAAGVAAEKRAKERGQT